MPQAGVIQMTIHGESLTYDLSSRAPNGQPLQPVHYDTASYATSCEFKNVDFTKSGSYSAFAKDDAHGTCKVEIERQ